MFQLPTSSCYVLGSFPHFSSPDYLLPLTIAPLLLNSRIKKKNYFPKVPRAPRHNLNLGSFVDIMTHLLSLDKSAILSTFYIDIDIVSRASVDQTSTMRLPILRYLDRMSVPIYSRASINFLPSNDDVAVHM